MSRTFKDRKERKTKRKKLYEPLWTKNFERSHYDGANEIDELELCPKCQHTTDFQDGFITCAGCGWGNYYPANELREEDEDFEYEIAS